VGWHVHQKAKHSHRVASNSSPDKIQVRLAAAFIDVDRHTVPTRRRPFDGAIRTEERDSDDLLLVPDVVGDDQIAVGSSRSLRKVFPTRIGRVLDNDFEQRGSMVGGRRIARYKPNISGEDG
jgi:hypothetical protein